ncbi:MAG: FAD-dependent oxidoreductase [Oscillospiraceae bacterium]|nr:FAD-dependent oxidoreductase [Oscillospiraceae bacterium]
MRYGAWAEKPQPIDEKDITKRLSADVVIAGAGIAGMSCALRAAQTGKRVIVVEKTASWSARGGNIGVSNSSFMKEKGIENDVEELSREWVKRSGNRCREGLVRRFLKESPRAMDWLLELVQRPEYHCRPELQGSFYKGETYREYYGSHRLFDGPMAQKGARPGAADAVFAMFEEAKRAGVTFLFRAPAVELIKENGRITGLIAKTEEGCVQIRASLGVVLATGDIGGNREMCEDLAPIANRCDMNIYSPKGANTGDGHRLGYWAGGLFEDAPFPTMLHPQSYHYRTCCFLFVKPDGSRFMNEDSYVQGKTVAVLREGVSYVWSLMDGRWMDKVPKTLPYGGGLFWGGDCLAGESEFNPEEETRMLEWGLKRGVVVQADSPEELADKMGVPKQSFLASFRRYNELCASGKDEDFGKRPELMLPLDTPPYYAMKFGPALLAVVGGLKVNERMEVQSASGTVPGLYAIGNTAGGRYGVDYPVIIPGNSHGTALTFGFLLGEEIGA